MISIIRRSMLRTLAWPRIEALFRSPLFWLGLIVAMCEISSLVLSGRFDIHPFDFQQSIAFAFIFLMQLAEDCGMKFEDERAAFKTFLYGGCGLYLGFAFSARWFSERWLRRLGFVVLILVLSVTAACIANVLSWDR